MKEIANAGSGPLCAVVFLSNVLFFYLGREKKNVKKKKNVTFIKKSKDNLGVGQSGKERLVKKDDDHNYDDDDIIKVGKKPTSVEHCDLKHFFLHHPITSQRPFSLQHLAATCVHKLIFLFFFF